MKKSFFCICLLISASIIFFACNNNQSLKTVDINQVQFRSDGIVYEINSQTPLTANVTGLLNLEDSVYLTYKNGLLEGPVLVKLKDGQLKISGNYHKGLVDGKIAWYRFNGETEADLIVDKNNKFPQFIIQPNFINVFERTQCVFYQYPIVPIDELINGAIEGRQYLEKLFGKPHDEDEDASNLFGVWSFLTISTMDFRKDAAVMVYTTFGIEIEYLRANNPQYILSATAKTLVALGFNSEYNITTQTTKYEKQLLPSGKIIITVTKAPGQRGGLHLKFYIKKVDL